MPKSHRNGLIFILPSLIADAILILTECNCLHDTPCETMGKI